MNKQVLLLLLSSAIGTQAHVLSLVKLAVKEYSQNTEAMLIDLKANKFNNEIKEILKKELIERYTNLFSVIPATILLTGHSDSITSVALSSDGRLALTGSDDKTARLWDLSTGKTIAVLTGHSAPITSVALSSDSKYALTGSLDKTAGLWDVATGKVIRVLEDHTDWVTSVTFSSDGTQVLTGSEDNTARLWDVNNPTIESLALCVSSATAVTLSQCGTQALIGCANKAVCLWDLTSAKDFHTIPRVWDMFSGGIIAILEDLVDKPISLTLSPDGQYALIAFSEGTVYIWDLTRITNNREIISSTQTNNISSAVAFSSDGKFALTGSSNNTVRLWNVKTEQTIATLIGHTNHVTSVAFSPSERYIIAGSEDSTARLWDSQYWYSRDLETIINRIQ